MSPVKGTTTFTDPTKLQWWQTPAGYWVSIILVAIVSTGLGLLVNHFGFGARIAALEISRDDAKQNSDRIESRVTRIEDNFLRKLP